MGLEAGKEPMWPENKAYMSGFISARESHFRQVYEYGFGGDRLRGCDYRTDCNWLDRGEDWCDE